MKLSKLLYEPINELSNLHNSGKFVHNTSLDQFSIFTKCKANVTTTLKQWELYMAITISN